MLLLFFLQRSMIFPGQSRSPEVLSTQHDQPLEEVWIDTSEGKVQTFFLSANPPFVQTLRPVVVFAHGNGELIQDWVHALITYLEMGIHVYLVEYPGYGNSAGMSSQQSIAETFDAAYGWVVQRKDVDVSRIIFHGRSIGGGVMIQLAAMYEPAAMILQSTFTSLRSFAKGYFVPGQLIRDPFDALPILKTYDKPLLIMHGDRDVIVPYQHALDLKDLVPQATVITYACGHNDFPPSWQIYWKDISNFLRGASIIEE